MIRSAQCALAERDGTAEAYARNRLGPEAREAFENHLLACRHCQDDVLLVAAARAELLRHEETPRRQRRVGLAATAMLAAAAVVLLIVWPAARAPGDVAALGSVAAAPSYLGVAVRGGPADSAFDAAMREYDTSNWDAAARALRAAAALGAPVDVAWFFAGASELMAGRAAQADSAFRRVLSVNDSPYGNEARFYRAKALLRLGRGRDALAALAEIPADITIGAHAAALSDSLRTLGVR